MFSWSGSDSTTTAAASRGTNGAESAAKDAEIQRLTEQVRKLKQRQSELEKQVKLAASATLKLTSEMATMRKNEGKKDLLIAHYKSLSEELTETVDRLTKDISIGVSSKERLIQRLDLYEAEEAKLVPFLAPHLKWGGIDPTTDEGIPTFLEDLDDYTRTKHPVRRMRAQWLFESRGSMSADVTFQEGYTALHFCAMYPILNGTLRWFLDQDEIDRNKKDNNGWTPLICAADGGNVENVETLLQDEEVHVNIADNEGETALMRAAFYNYIEIVSLLLKYGCDKELRDKKGKTALDKANEEKHTDVIALLQ